MNDPALVTRVRTLIAEAIEERGLRIDQIPIRRELLARALGRRGASTITVRSLARIADALGYDVIVQFRTQRGIGFAIGRTA